MEPPKPGPNPPKKKVDKDGGDLSFHFIFTMLSEDYYIFNAKNLQLLKTGREERRIRRKARERRTKVRREKMRRRNSIRAASTRNSSGT